jgi:inosine/xanthosine triphosphate pyrophosphatase family protein
MHKIGLVGPQQSIQRVLTVSNEFEHEIQFIPFPYEDAQEVKEIVKEHQNQVDGWFFSGPVPYIMAKKVLSHNANYVYTPYTGSSLYKCLLQMAYYQKQVVQGISIDMIQSENVEESLLELEIPIENIYVRQFDENYNRDELIQFHLQLWKQGKTKGVLTSLYAVYQALRQEGVPVYRIFMTKMEIRQALKIIVEKVKSSYFKDTQIGVEIIEIDQFDRIAEKSKTHYYLKHMELKIQQTLLPFVERIDGSLIENGNGRYQIFSSRGAIEREIEMLRSTVQQISLDVGAPVAVGIGFGETGYSAEMNARIAVQHAKSKGDCEIVAIDDSGLIIESIGQEEELAYSYRSDNKEMVEKLKKANISTKTYKKIEALVQRMGWSGFTTADLASHLSMTVRNAQRIIGGLCEAGLAECIGEKQSSTRGRPGKIYKLRN